MKKTVLLVGFEPFGGDGLNPSEEIADALDGETVNDRTVVGRVLPCEFGESRLQLAKLIRSVHPELVLAVGQAGGRAEITPERVAINVDDARIPDNAGRQPIDRPIVRGGPAAYWSTLPIKAMVAALKGEGIPAAVSQTAGTFVCNHVFYALMHELRWQRKIRGGFVHVPWTSAQAAKRKAPGMPLEQMVRGIALALETAVSVRRDLRETGGRIS
jgi:pyroglutamyl-peptidase